MGKVDEQNKSKEEEQYAATEGDVVAPEHEELVRDKEREDDEGKPGNDLGAPVAILDRSPRVLRGCDAEEEAGKDQVEETESEVDAMDGKPAVTLSGRAIYLDVVKCQML